MAAAHDVHGLFAQREGYGWQRDAEELRQFFRWYEADVHFSSTFSAMLAAAAGVAMGSGPPASWDPYAAIVDRITAGTRVYRRLKAMDAAGEREEVIILHRLHGPRNGATEHVEFGDLAPLAVLTDAAAAVRDDLVLRQSTARERHLGEGLTVTLAERRADNERIFWWCAHKLDRLERRRIRLQARLVADPPDEGAQTKIDALRAKRVAWQTLQAKSLDAFLGAHGATLRARLSAITSIDREVSVEDAIRAKLDAGRRKKDPQTKAARDVFVTEVRLEAEKMRRRAHEAYRRMKDAES